MSICTTDMVAETDTYNSGGIEDTRLDSIPCIPSDSTNKTGMDIENVDGDEVEEEDKNEIEFLIPDPPFDQISRKRLISLIILISMTQLLTQSFMAQTILPYHYISKSFGVENKPGEISWMTASYSLTIGTFILIAGRFGDLLGYKKMYILSYLNLTIWSILCGLSKYSKSIEFFDICRGMQGLSFAISMPNSLAIIGHYFPDGKVKILAFTLFAAVAPGGFYIGSLWCSMFVLKSSWEWMFYIGSIISMIILIIGYLIIPNNIGTKYKNKINYKMFDPIGSILGVSSLILINFVFNQGSVVGWETTYIYILLIIGILIMILFIYSQRIVKYPLIPKLNYKIIMTLICISSGWSSFGIFLFYSLRFSLDILKQSPIVISVQLTPILIMGFIASGLTGLLIKKIPISIILMFSMICFEIAMILNGLKPVKQIYWIQRFLSYLIAPFAMDTSFPAGTILLSNYLPRENQGVAGSLIATCVNYSIAIGLGIAGTVEYYSINRFKQTELQSIRNSFYTGMGLAGFGIVTGILFNLIIYVEWRKKGRNSGNNENELNNV